MTVDPVTKRYFRITLLGWRYGSALALHAGGPGFDPQHLTPLKKFTLQTIEEVRARFL
jgi:hypothetical protein